MSHASQSCHQQELYHSTPAPAISQPPSAQHPARGGMRPLRNQTITLHPKWGHPRAQPAPAPTRTQVSIPPTSTEHEQRWSRGFLGLHLPWCSLAGDEPRLNYQFAQRGSATHACTLDGSYCRQQRAEKGAEDNIPVQLKQTTAFA